MQLATPSSNCLQTLLRKPGSNPCSLAWTCHWLLQTDSSTLQLLFLCSFLLSCCFPYSVFLFICSSCVLLLEYLIIYQVKEFGYISQTLGQFYQLGSFPYSLGIGFTFFYFCCLLWYHPLTSGIFITHVNFLP